MIFCVVLLLFTTTTRAAITQRDLRSIFVHHQEFCRETAPRLGGNGLKQYRTSHAPTACATSEAHEWHVNTDAVLDEEIFQTQLHHRRRQLTAATTPQPHIYLARITTGTLATSDLRTTIETNTGVSFDEYFKANQDNREYFLLYTASPTELVALEQEKDIDEIIPLPFDWKLSPLLLSDDGFHKDTAVATTQYKTLQLKISPRAKTLMKATTTTTMSTLSATIYQDLIQHNPAWAYTITVQSAGAEGASHFATVAAAQHQEELSEWIVVSNIPSHDRDAVANRVATFPQGMCVFSILCMCSMYHVPCIHTCVDTFFVPLFFYIKVIRVEPILMHTVSNAWARWVTQSYLGATTDTTKDISKLQRATIWNRGITGAGQVVGVGDSGLAHKNCLFNEPGKTITVARGATFNDPNHRKVVQYVAFADGVAGEDRDHGTHVSGSVAGNAVMGGTLGEYNGMAPAAKLAFFDIGRAGARGLR